MCMGMLNYVKYIDKGMARLHRTTWPENWGQQTSITHD